MQAPVPAVAEAATTPIAADAAFEVLLASSGRRFTIPPSKSILDVLFEAGIEPMFDCMRGECGVCQVGLLQGEADHRDVILTNAERAANTVIQICVSRAKTALLVLDL